MKHFHPARRRADGAPEGYAREKAEMGRPSTSPARRLMVLIVVLVALSGPAGATVVTSLGAWTDTLSGANASIETFGSWFGPGALTEMTCDPKQAPCAPLTAVQGAATAPGDDVTLPHAQLHGAQNTLNVQFGCDTRYYPCVGMEELVIDLPAPIIGLYADASIAQNLFPPPGGTYWPSLNGEALPSQYPCSSGGDMLCYEGFVGFVWSEPVTRLVLSIPTGSLDGGITGVLEDIHVAVVPEPASIPLALAGLIGMGWRKRRNGLDRHP